MKPNPTSDSVRQRMRNTAQRDNAVELAVRSALHRLGFRFRIHQRVVPGTKRTVDILLPRHRLAVFVNGCFWHGCPIHATWPKRNAEFWRIKIEANRERDADTDRRLQQAGWRVIRIWEHEQPNEAALRVAELIRAGDTSRTPNAKKSK